MAHEELEGNSIGKLLLIIVFIAACIAALIPIAREVKRRAREEEEKAKARTVGVSHHLECTRSVNRWAMPTLREVKGI